MNGNGVLPPGGDDKDTGKELDVGQEVEERMVEEPVAPEPEAPEPVAPEPEPELEPEAEAPAPEQAVKTVAGVTSASSMIEEYQAMVKWNSLIRTVFPVFVLALISVFLIVTFMGVMSAFPDKKITQETVKAGQEILPIINKVLKSFVDEVAPQLAEEFQRGLEEGSERLGKSLAKELERLEVSSAEAVKTKVHDAIQFEKSKHIELLLELYPELKDDPEKLEKLASRLNKAFEMWTVKYMLGILEDYYLAMAKINDTVSNSYRAPAVGTSADGKAEEAEMMELFMELMNAAYVSEEDGTAAADAVKDEKPTAPEEAPVPEEVEAAPAAEEKAPEGEGEAAPPAEEAAKTETE